MSRRVLAATLAALTLSASSLSAQTVYSNGAPTNLNGNAIGQRFEQAHDFVLGASTSLGAFNWWAIVYPYSSPETIQADYTVSVYQNTEGSPGTSLFSQTFLSQTGTSDGSYCCANYLVDYKGYTFSANLGGLTLGPGTYWISVTGFSVDNAYWLQAASNGSLAEHQSYGGGWQSTGFASGEGAFNLTATPATDVPEPASLALVASGFLGLAVIARRRRGGLRTIV